MGAITAITNWAIAHTVAHFATEPVEEVSVLGSYIATRTMHPWLVACEEGRVVGFAHSSPWKGRCAYDWTAEATVYVDEAFHRRGIGRALYERLFAVLRAQGYRSVLGGITLPNAASVRLHEAMGMERVALLADVGYKFGAWHTVGYWAVELNQAATPPAPVRPVAEVVDSM